MTALLAIVNRVRFLHVLALVAGGFGFALLVDRVGWHTIRDAVGNAGWWFLWIALIDLASVFSDALGVYCFVRSEAPAKFWRVFAAQASGIAINRLTPGNSVGEAIKVTMMLGDVPKPVAVASIVKFNLTTLYIALAVVVIGVPLTLLGLDLPGRVQLAIYISTGVLVAFGIALAMLVRRGAIGTLVDGVRRIGFISERRAERWTERVAAIDTSITSFGSPYARRAIAAIACSRLLHFTGTIAVLYAAGVPFTPPVVIAMLSIGIIVTWLSNVVPLGIGLADGSNYFLYGMLGANPIAGIAFTMVNRTRTIVLAAMGLSVMFVANLVERRGPPSVRAADTLSAGGTAAPATAGR